MIHMVGRGGKGREGQKGGVLGGKRNNAVAVATVRRGERESGRRQDAGERGLHMYVADTGSLG